MLTVTQLLERFDSQTQELVLYHYIEGLTQAEIAKVTHISRRTIGKRLRNFAERCRHILNALEGAAEEIRTVNDGRQK